MNDADSTLPLSIKESQFTNKGIVEQCHFALTAIKPQTLNAKILELACDDHAIGQQFIRLLIDTNRITLSVLHDAFNIASWDAVVSAAHRIAGSARMLDCADLINLLVQLEAAARQREADLARMLLQAVANIIDALDAALQELLDGAMPY